MKNQLSANLIALMDYHRIGGAQLARLIDIPLSTIKNIRKGTNINPTIETLIPLANYFNVTLEEIISCNFSAEKLAEKNSTSIKTVPQTVPVISWEEAINWPKYNLQENLQIFTEKSCSEQTFAVSLGQSISEIFTAPGIFLIDPMQEPAHFDYVLVHKLGFVRASIKQCMFDDDIRYLRSLLVTRKLEALDENYRLLGVVIEYRHLIKSIDTVKIRSNINLVSLKNQKISELF